MHQALYREFRPTSFDELIGQEHIVRILKSQIASGNTSHAYIFSGTRGTGKTTTARILAKALNCTGEGEKPCGVCSICRAIADGSFIDVIEIDAASNNGVDNIRDLTDSVMYAPTVGKYKVYIIDEVHMLSAGAFNALLKTLEEPPEYVVFILATTEPQKVPATILSRCMRLDFRRVSEKALVENMKRICSAKGIEAEDAALALIAVNADGSVRDSLSILEQCIVPGEKLRRDDAAAVLGTAGEESLLQITDLVINGDTSGALLLLNDIINAGADVRAFMKEWLEHFRNLLLARYVDRPGDMLNMSDENAARLIDQAGRITQGFLDRAVNELTGTISQTKWSPRPRVMLEMSIVKLCQPNEPEALRCAGTADTSDGGPYMRSRGHMHRTGAQGGAAAAPESRRTVQQHVPDRDVSNRYDGVKSGKLNKRTSDIGTIAEMPYDKGLQDAPYDDIPPWEELNLQYNDTQPAEVPDQTRTSNEDHECLQSEAPSHEDSGESLHGQLSLDDKHSSAEDRSDGIFCEQDWSRAVEDAAGRHGMYSRLINGTFFEGAADGMISISSDNPNTERALLSARPELERIIEQQTGRRFSINIVKKNSRDTGAADSERRALEEFFGHDVTFR